MVIDQLNLVKNQAKGALRSQVSGSAAKLRAQTSLVGQAGRLTGRMRQQLNEAEKNILQSPKGRTHRVETVTAAPKTEPVKPAPDGYVRQSAVQPIRVAADYHRRIIRRIVSSVVLVVCVLAVLWLLMKTNLLAK